MYIMTKNEKLYLESMLRLEAWEGLRIGIPAEYVKKSLEHRYKDLLDLMDPIDLEDYNLDIDTIMKEAVK